MPDRDQAATDPVDPYPMDDVEVDGIAVDPAGEMERATERLRAQAWKLSAAGDLGQPPASARRGRPRGGRA